MPMLCASRPAADWLQGLEAAQVLAGQLMSKCHSWLNVYLCRFHYKKPHLWLSPSTSLTIQLLSSETALSEAPVEAAGSFRYWVLVQDPCPGSWLREDLPPATNSSRGCF